MLRKFVLTVSMGILFTTSLSTQISAQNINSENLPDANSPFLSQLVAQAKRSAQQDYRPADAIKNETLNQLSYQQYKAIRFKPSESIFNGLYPYEVQLFHSGFLYKQPVNINVIDYKNRVNSLPFSTQYFNYGALASEVPSAIQNGGGFAGLRVHYPLNNSKYKDELVSFLGATYFRLVGSQQKYGISARGLAIDTGMPEGEEFPYFTDFWLLEPANGKTLTIYAKMDSPSITGVYKFTIQANSQAEIEVSAWLFAREDIDKLGLAPFTSMFLYGENSMNKPDDYRPEVHDSDGLMLLTSTNEQLFRPLNNPNRLRITSLADTSPKGFGMLQRDIQYQHYLDSEADYHLRPGVWVSPQAGFSKGRLELVEIPTTSETNDNIVAYWVNDNPVRLGDSLFVSYQLKTVSADPHEYKQASVLRTLQGANRLPGEKSDDESLTRRFIVDFTMPDGIALKAESLSANISASNGTIDDMRVFTSNFNNEIRASFLFTPKDGKSVNDMRVIITHNDKPISEVWTYVYEK